MRRSSRKTKIHNKTETANETTRTNGTDDTTEVATHKLNVDAAQNLCDNSSVTASFANGVRVKNIPRIHNVGHPREDSKSDERPTV